MFFPIEIAFNWSEEIFEIRKMISQLVQDRSHLGRLVIESCVRACQLFL